MTDSLRALKFLVIGMGVAIVVGTAVVVATIVQRAGAGWGTSGRPGPPSKPPRPMPHRTPDSGPGRSTCPAAAASWT